MNPMIKFVIESVSGPLMTHRCLDPILNTPEHIEWLARMFSETNGDARVRVYDESGKEICTYSLTRSIEFVKFDRNCEALYTNDNYAKAFAIIDKYDEVHTVRIDWVQGRSNNYRFVIGSDLCFGEDFISPEDVIWVEKR